jgi:hypothetical protein
MKKQSLSCSIQWQRAVNIYTYKARKGSETTKGDSLNYLNKIPVMPGSTFVMVMVLPRPSPQLGSPHSGYAEASTPFSGDNCSGRPIMRRGGKLVEFQNRRIPSSRVQCRQLDSSKDKNRELY